MTNLPRHADVPGTARLLRALGSVGLALLAGSLAGSPLAQPTPTPAAVSKPPSSPKGSATPNTMEPSDKSSNPRRLIISKTTSAGRSLQVGTLDFDEANRATLHTEGEGPAVEELKAAWAEISKAPELIWKQYQPGEVGGEKVTRVVGEKVRPGDDIYIYAVLDTLSRKYGFQVDLAK